MTYDEVDRRVVPQLAATAEFRPVRHRLAASGSLCILVWDAAGMGKRRFSNLAFFLI